MAQQPAVNPAYYAQPPPAYVESSKPVYPQAPEAQAYPAYQPPPLYPVQPPPPSTVIVEQPQQTVVVVSRAVFGELPTQAQCPHCQQQVVTTVSHEIGVLTWLICGLLFLFGLILCAFIPCCCDSTKDVIHKCPSCKQVIGVKRRL